MQVKLSSVLFTSHPRFPFENFDELLLLKSGRRVVYHGPLGHDSRTLIDYFERNGPRKCPPHTNPAEYMLEAIGAGNPDYKGKD
jgi:ATP-binding cassette, subfamily G (WHITE), member 2, SNQ2